MRNAAKSFCRRALTAALLFGAAAVLSGCKIEIPKNSPLYHSPSSVVSEISSSPFSSEASSQVDFSKGTKSSQISDSSSSCSSKSSFFSKTKTTPSSAASANSKTKSQVKKRPDTPKKTTSSKDSKSTPAKQSPPKNNSSKKSDVKKQNVCTLSIRCDNVFHHLNLLNNATRSQIPKNGIIMASHTVILEEGDTVFSVLKRETQKQGIPLNYTTTPGVNSIYVKGIGCLSEFSCGDKSGWQYSVNHQFPMIPCDKYKISPHESISWQYTCDFGRDLM